MNNILIFTGFIILIIFTYSSYKDLNAAAPEPKPQPEPEPEPQPASPLQMPPPILNPEPEPQPEPPKIKPYTPQRDPERENLEKIAANLLLYSGVKNKNVFYDVHEMSTDQLKIIIADYYINKEN